MSYLNRELLLHVGLLKTGSTTLQRTLFPHHSQIFYLGKHDDSPVTKGFLSEEAYTALSPALWKLNRHFDAAKVSEIYQDEILAEVPDEKVLLGSWEGLGNRPAQKYLKMLGRINQVFGSCRVMYVLRNPLTQVPSEYLENISGRFFEGTGAWMGPSASLGIDTWYAKRANKKKGPGETLTYNQNIKASVELLGKNSVGVFLFEDLLADSESYYRAISNFIGIDPEETYAHTQQKHFNPRMTQGQLDLLRKIDSSYLSRGLFSCFNPRWRRFLSRKLAKDTGSARAELTPGLQEIIHQSTRDGHRWLVENLDLPLEKYGYPL